MSSSTSTLTAIEVSNRFTYEWVLTELKDLQTIGQNIKSPIFHTTTNKVEWRLSLSSDPYGYGERNIKPNVALDLHLHSHKGETIQITANAKVSILSTAFKCTLTHTYEAKGKYRFSPDIPTSHLQNLKCCTPITIRCEIDIPREIMTECTNPRRIAQALASQEGQLRQDFGLLFKEPKFSDIFVIAGTHKFPAHKLILATRSSVFSAMFEHKETQENLKNEVKIENMEPDVVKAMLEFFYTDQVTNLEELAYGLLEAADKYDVQRLRSMCERNIYKTLNKENAAEILCYANLHRAYKLKMSVMEFMDKNLIDVVVTEDYKRLMEMYPELSNELILVIASRRK